MYFLLYMWVQPTFNIITWNYVINCCCIMEVFLISWDSQDCGIKDIFIIYDSACCYYVAEIRTKNFHKLEILSKCYLSTAKIFVKKIYNKSWQYPLKRILGALLRNLEHYDITFEYLNNKFYLYFFFDRSLTFFWERNERNQNLREIVRTVEVAGNVVIIFVRRKQYTTF